MRFTAKIEFIQSKETIKPVCLQDGNTKKAKHLTLQFYH